MTIDGTRPLLEQNPEDRAQDLSATITPSWGFSIGAIRAMIEARSVL
jgi:hypothetical protein